MRRILEMFQEIAIAANPAKEAQYSEAYPLIDQSIATARDVNGAGRGSLNAVQLSEAMTTADFPFVLGEFIDRALWPVYQRFVFPFQPLVFNDITPNFLKITRYQRQAGVDDLELVRPKTKVGAGSIDDGFKREYRVYRWEKAFDFEMEAIVNDDLGYFRDMAGIMGEAARRTIEKFVSRMYFNTTTIAGLVAAGANFSSTAKLTNAALMTAWAAFNARVDARGEPISVRPLYLVVHKQLEPTALQILASPFEPDTPNYASNVLPRLELIVDPYLTGAAPDLPWLLFAPSNENGIRTLTLARLQGRPGPVVLQKAPDQMSFSGFGRTGALLPGLGDFETGNIKLKVADVWGAWDDSVFVGVTDEKGIYFSDGTA